MFDPLRNFLASPNLADDRSTRAARVLNVVIQVLAVYLLAGGLYLAFSRWELALLSLSTVILLFVLRHAAFHGQLRLMSRLLTLALWLVFSTLGLYAFAASSVLYTLFLLVVLLAFSLLGTGSALLFALLSALAGGLMLYLRTQHTLPPLTATAELWLVLFNFGQAVGLLYLHTSGLQQALTRSRREERDLRELTTTLSQHIAGRTRALATSAEVSRRLAAILDPKQLVLAVVEEIQRAFGYYHAHIYIWDPKREFLLMSGGTGEAGQIMLTQGHKIPRGKGLVGRAAETNGVVLVSDVTENADWLANPLLPDTKCEIAVPIATGGQVLGVLDVQHNIVDGLEREDAQLLQTIANQVAVALQNARSYAFLQERAERELSLNTINQKILRAVSVDEVLQIAIRELTHILGAHKASVQLSLTSESQPE